MDINAQASPQLIGQTLTQPCQFITGTQDVVVAMLGRDSEGEARTPLTLARLPGAVYISREASPPILGSSARAPTELRCLLVVHLRATAGCLALDRFDCMCVFCAASELTYYYKAACQPYSLDLYDRSTVDLLSL